MKATRLVATLLALACSTAVVYAYFVTCNGGGDGANGGYSAILSGTGWTYIVPNDASNNKARVETWVEGMSVAPTCPVGFRYGNACAAETGYSRFSQNVNSQADYYRGTGVYSFGCFTVRHNHFYIDASGVYHGPTAGALNPLANWYCVPAPPHHDPVICPADGPYYCGSSPILVPTGASQAVHVSAPEVTFDIDGDGTTELVAWPEDGNALAFLAYDKNGNGIIDNGGELLGNHFAPNTMSGFDAIQSLLAAAGQPSGVGSITEDNPVFAKLLLWNDRNRNGVSDDGELRPASAVLHKLGLGYFTTDRADPDGSAYLFKGWAEFKQQNGGVQTKPVYDVVFATTP